MALVATGVFGGAALVVTTDYLEDAALGIGESVESVYAAAELDRQLLRHNRSLLLAGVTGQRGYNLERRDAARQIERLLIAVREQTVRPEEISGDAGTLDSDTRTPRGRNARMELPDGSRPPPV